MSEASPPDSFASRALALLPRALAAPTPTAAAELIVAFVREEVGLPRAALLLDDRGVGIAGVVALAGFGEGDVAKRAAAFRLPAASTLAAAGRAGVPVMQAGKPEEAAREVAEAFTLDELVAVPLSPSPGVCLGFLVAGRARAAAPEEAAPLADKLRLLVDLAPLVAAVFLPVPARRTAEQAKLLLEGKRTEMARLVEEVTEHQRAVRADLIQAQKLQQSILPDPPTVEGVDVHIFFRPAEVVSGDLYDVAAADAHNVRVFVADATGHGMAAALATMFIKSEYEIAKRAARGPASALRILNERIARTYKNIGLRFTAIAMNLDVKNGVLTYATGGHPGPLLVQGGRVEELPAGGPFLGVTADVAFPEERFDVRRGDLIVAYTDGLSEVFSPQGEPFGEARLKAALARSVNLNQPAGPLIWKRLTEFMGPNQTPPDDMALVALRYYGPPAPGAPS